MKFKKKKDMKRLIMLAAIAFAAISCSGTFKVEGTVTNSDALQKGAVVLAGNDNTRTTDTIAVVDGKFTFEAPASDSTSYIFTLANAATGKPFFRSSALIIAEKGKAVINFSDKAEIISAGRLTKGIQELNDTANDVYNDYFDKADSLSTLYGDNDPKFMEALKAVQDSATEFLINFNEKVFRENPDNILGLTALKNNLIFYSLEQLEEAYEKAGDFIRANSTIAGALDTKRREKATAEGSMFVDFEGKSPEGEVSRLSDYVGRGKYVLVDFWASWCGPCRQEIPNIKELYEKYTDKGLVVLGVAVWDNDNSESRKTMELLSMEWNQIFVGTDRTPTTLYGISGIPHIILFGPDGKIVRRNLRGEEMKSTVSALYE